jgi:hypothetical protein
VFFAPATDADPVLDSVSKTGLSLIQQWKLTCNHLSSAISPGQLRLTLFCDIANLVSGEKVIEILWLAYLPNSLLFDLDVKGIPVLESLLGDFRGQEIKWVQQSGPDCKALN